MKSIFVTSVYIWAWLLYPNITSFVPVIQKMKPSGEGKRNKSFKGCVVQIAASFFVPHSLCSALPQHPLSTPHQRSQPWTTGRCLWGVTCSAWWDGLCKRQAKWAGLFILLSRGKIKTNNQTNKPVCLEGALFSGNFNYRHLLLLMSLAIVPVTAFAGPSLPSGAYQNKSPSSNISQVLTKFFTGLK